MKAKALQYYMHDGPAAFRFEMAGDLSAGYGSHENLLPRNPRLTFEEAGRFAKGATK
jgi:hypothetical protein